mgnify:CR=1 FL=1
MQNNVEIIQINISGEDKPGMTSSLTEILARYDAFILDIGQANIHQSLTLGILFKTTSDKSGNIMKELLFKASELGVMIRFTPISEQNYDNWVGRQGKNRYIITLLGRTVTARHIAEVTRVVAQHGLNIDAIKRLTGRIPLSEDDRAAKSCIELSVRGSLTDEERSTMQEGFMNLSEIGLDVSFQKDDIYRRSRRLICFDMDSTLIETEVIDELAERAGVGDAVREITARAMRGEIDFRESFTERVALLKGLDVSVMEEIARNLPITEGLERMMTILKRVGYKTAILSGGFTYFGNYLRQKYGFDYVYANELEIEDGKLDTACVKAFRVPAGTLVEVFNTTLHYTPCMVDDGGFQVMVALPAGTNGPRPEAAADMPTAGDSYCYWKADKWVLCHADSPKAAEGGYVGLIGKNLDIAVD